MPDADQGEGQSNEGLHKVVIDGVESEVSTEDLVAGFQFSKHNTQTAQSLSAKEKRIDELVESRATDLYTKALEEAESPDSNESKSDDVLVNDGNKALLDKIAKLEEHQANQDRSSQEKQDKDQIDKILDTLGDKYKDMDRDKVLIQFYNEAKETDDVNEAFENFAKSSHESVGQERQRIIDAYVESKTKDPFGRGETGGSSNPATKPVEPAKDMAEARERAYKRLYPDG